MDQELKSNRLVFAGPFMGEFGWELSHWVPHMRWLRKQYPDRHLAVASFPGRHPLYAGVADEFWPLPEWFTRESYDLDCFESLVSASRLVQESTYGKLLQHFRGIYEGRFQDVIETRTPRGFNKILRQSGQVAYERFRPSADADQKCQQMISAAGGKPVVILFARSVERTMFLNISTNVPCYVRDLATPLPSRNWPAPYWERLFEMLYSRFGRRVTFVIGGTKAGNCLLSAAEKYENVIPLFNEDVSVSLDLTIAFLNRAMASISSQSGPTHLSVQCGCPSFIYGHEEHRHAIDDNPLRAEVVFLKTPIDGYVDPPEVLFKDAAVFIDDLMGPGAAGENPAPGQASEARVDAGPAGPSPNINRIGMVGVFEVEGSSNIPFARAIQNLGMAVDVFNYRTVARDAGYDAMNRAIADEFMKKSLDAVIFCKANGVTSHAMAECSRHATTCWYMMDSVDHLNDPRFGAEYVRCAQACNLTVVTSAAMKDELARRGVTKPVFHVLQGVDPGEFRPAADVEKTCDVVFIGSETARRTEIVTAIRSWGHTVHTYGPGWDRPPVHGWQFSLACASAKVCLAMSNSDPDVNSFSDRVLRYLSTGSCVLTEYTAGLEEHFEARKHLVWFDDITGIKKPLETLLQVGAPARETIARRGHEHFLENFTWHHAAKKVLGHIKEVRSNEKKG